MKKKIWLIPTALAATLCLCFGIAACEKEPSGVPADGPQAEQNGGTPEPDDGNGGEQKPDDNQGGNTDPGDNGGENTDPGGNGGENPGGNGDNTDPGDNEEQKPEEHKHSYTAENVCSVCGEKWEYTEGLEYTPDKKTDTYIVTGIGTASGNVVLPYGHEGKSVTSIGERAFVDCSSLTSVTIPDSVISIGDWAFYGCSGLTSVTIGNGVTSIGNSAFEGCSGLTKVNITDLAAWCKIDFGSYDANPLTYAYHLYLNETEVTNLTIPNEITEIKAYVFCGCMGLESVTIGSSVTSIGRQAFYGCSSLTSIEIPDSVTSIGNSAFKYCYKLVEVWNYSKLDITKGSDEYGYVAYYAKNIYTANEESKRTVTNEGYIFYEDENGSSYLLGYQGSETALTLPDKSPTSKNYEIYQFAFAYCSNLTSITIPNGVTSIGHSAFRGCSGLTSVTIGSGVTEIGEWAFSDCYKLVEVWNYSELDIKQYSMDNGYVAYYAKNVYTANEESKRTVTNEGYIFYEDENGSSYLLGYQGSETALTLPDKSPTSKNYEIYQYAFYNCSELTSIVIPESVTSIGNSAFEGCTGLESVTIGNGVTSIERGAFYGCSGLTSVTIGSGVTEIGEWAFKGCSGLESIVIPESVTSIGEYAFYGCSGLEKITVAEENPNYSSQDGILYNKEKTTIVYVPLGIKGEIVLPESVTSIGEAAFKGCSRLESIVIPNSVTSIGYEAFAWCRKLTIYCEADEQPAGWDTYWNPDGRPVEWGYKNN